MTTHSPLTSTFLLAAARLSDRDLLDATAHASALERRTTADLLALLAELDSRKLYLGEGCSSLFTYCTRVLHLSEPAAYSRITAARVARRFPIVLVRLGDGDLTLTSISLLAAHLTDENSDALLDAARHASKRDVERLVASLYAQPDIPASVRRLPATDASPSPESTPESATSVAAPFTRDAPLRPSSVHVPAGPPRRDGADRATRASQGRTPLAPGPYSSAGGSATRAPHSCCGQTRCLEPRLGSMRLRRVARPVPRDRHARIPPRRALRPWRPFGCCQS